MGEQHRAVLAWQHVRSAAPTVACRTLQAIFKGQPTSSLLRGLLVFTACAIPGTTVRAPRPAPPRPASSVESTHPCSFPGQPVPPDSVQVSWRRRPPCCASPASTSASASRWRSSGTRSSSSSAGVSAHLARASCASRPGPHVPSRGACALTTPPVRAGEDEASLQGKVRELRQRGIGSILDYAAEDDVPLCVLL